MRSLSLSNSPWFRTLAVSAWACVMALPVLALGPKPPKYPLRVHVLASDETHRTQRMSPGEAVACDGISGTLDSIAPDSGGGWVSISGVAGDPCSSHPELVMARLMNATDTDPVFSGAGRGDLVTPPGGTQAFNFQYDNCSRVRVRPGFDSLPARWKKPGRQLEVLMPSDAIPRSGRPLRPVRCSFNVTMHDFVYLLLRNGRIVEVSQEVYWARPALRLFLSGVAQTVQPRVQDFTVPAYPKK